MLAISAGTAPLTGHPIDPPSAEALRKLGGDPAGHEAQRLTARMIDSADLILTAETSHRSIALQTSPLALRRCFTLREFARLSVGIDLAIESPPSAAALRDGVAAVAAQRGNASPPDAGEDDIVDPFGQPPEIAWECAKEVAAAVDGTIRALRL